MKNMKKALITGITGQDGAYLAQLLLEKGYRVFGGARRSASRSLWRLRELGIQDRVQLVPLELRDPINISHVLENVRPDEIYNLAAQSHVGTSFDQPMYTTEVNALGVLNLIESVRKVCPEARFYQASTSEMFGDAKSSPQHEETTFCPCSPYGVSKVFAHYTVAQYREAFGMFACSGILFNHESRLRGREFVTRKITHGLAQIVRGERDVLKLGNLGTYRDWGFAGDYVKGMHAMLQQDTPDDFVLATGRAHTVRDFADLAMYAAGLPLQWEQRDVSWKAYDSEGKVRIEESPDFYRPVDVIALRGLADKAREILEWKPVASLEQLVEMMVKADMDNPDRDGA